MKFLLTFGLRQMERMQITNLSRIIVSLQSLYLPKLSYELRIWSRLVFISPPPILKLLNLHYKFLSLPLTTISLAISFKLKFSLNENIFPKLKNNIL